MEAQEPKDNAQGKVPGKKPPGLLAWLMPLMAAAAIVAIIIFLPRRDHSPPGSGPVLDISPPATVEIPFIGHPGIDTLIAGGSRAMARKDYLEAERLLTRARFFVKSGMEVGEIKTFPAGLSFFAGLAACYRGFPDKGVPMIREEIERDPGGSMYLYYLAHIRISQGKGQEGKKLLSRAAMGAGVFADLAREEMDKLK